MTKIKRIQISSWNRREICSADLCTQVLSSNDICSLGYLRRILRRAVVARKALSRFHFLYFSKCLCSTLTWAQYRSMSQCPHTVLCCRQYYNYPHATNGETKSHSKVGTWSQICCRVHAPSHSVKWILGVDFRLSLWKYLVIYQYGKFWRC